MKVNRQELFKLAGYLGGAFLVAGYIRYSVQEVLGNLEKALLGVGAALLIFSLVTNYRQIAAWFGTRSGRLGTNTALLTLAVVVILAIANFLGFRHHKRIDLTSEKLYSLSDQTKSIVSNLQKDVKILKFDRTEDIELRDRMTEYEDLSSRIDYEWVDPDKKREVALQYKISRIGEVVVTSGDRIERPQGTSEQELTNAILKVTRDQLKTVCFVEGHGERSLSDTQEEGFAAVEKTLKNENYEIKTISLAASNQPLSDCAVLVIAGPKQPFLAPEVAALGKYLDGGGKAMVLVDPETDPQLNEVFRAWNVELGNDTVIDVSAAGQMFGGGPYAPLVMSYGSHPITKDFARTMTIFPLARSVKVGSASGTGATTVSLLTTSEASWGETEIGPNKTPEMTEGKDAKGPLSLGVVATKTSGDKEGRLVVIGDSDFATNRAINFQRNGDLFMNSINWLAQDEDLISIRPKSQTNRRVDLTESQQNLLFWLLVAAMPVAVIGSGAYVWWKRR